MGSGLHVCMVTASLVQLVLQGRSRPRPSPRHDYVARLACFKPIQLEGVRRVEV
jgi:hypothetical protein